MPWERAVEQIAAAVAFFTDGVIVGSVIGYVWATKRKKRSDGGT